MKNNYKRDSMYEKDLVMAFLELVKVYDIVNRNKSVGGIEKERSGEVYGGKI